MLLYLEEGDGKFFRNVCKLSPENLPELSFRTLPIVRNSNKLEISFLLFTILDDGQSPQTKQFWVLLSSEAFTFYVIVLVYLEDVFVESV
jgi:hypothetical protein